MGGAGADPASRYDVIIVGGGPAGLSAALVLGRCRRRVLVCDEGRPRNGAARAMHGFLTRDGIDPHELLRLGREELRVYGVEFCPQRVTAARCRPGRPGEPRFEITLPGGRTLAARRLLLATGVRDELPAVPGLAEQYGACVHHCPYCDGWEHRGQPLLALGAGAAAIGLALALRTWSGKVTACTQGRVSAAQQERAGRNGVTLRPEPLVRLERGPRGRGLRAHFAAGPPLAAGALFFNTPVRQHSGLPLQLGCELDRNGQVRTHGRQRTRIPGLYLAGDADGDVQFVIVAAAEGATAAVAINRELQEEQRGDRWPAPPAGGPPARRGR